MRGFAGMARNGFADGAAIAYGFASMCVRGFKAEKPGTLYCMSSRLVPVRRLSYYRPTEIIGQAFVNIPAFRVRLFSNRLPRQIFDTTLKALG
jgi:hypothetical protein